MTIHPEAPARPAADPIQVTDTAVLAVAVRMHDNKCLQKASCTRREGHAWEDFGRMARTALITVAAAREAGEV